MICFKIQKLKADCLDLRENIIANFDLLEKLKLFQKHLEDPKYSHLLTKRDLDPSTKYKFDEIKHSYNYIDSQLDNVREMLADNKKKRQE